MINDTAFKVKELQRSKVHYNGLTALETKLAMAFIEQYIESKPYILINYDNDNFDIQHRNSPLDAAIMRLEIPLPNTVFSIGVSFINEQWMFMKVFTDSRRNVSAKSLGALDLNKLQIRALSTF